MKVFWWLMDTGFGLAGVFIILRLILIIINGGE